MCLSILDTDILGADNSATVISVPYKLLAFSVESAELRFSNAFVLISTRIPTTLAARIVFISLYKYVVGKKQSNTNWVPSRRR